MKIIDYYTAGGKNLITEYIDNLPSGEKAVCYRIRENIANEGISALKTLKTRQLKGKLWEIKYSQNRIMYVLQDSENIYFLHACKKQKDKAEQFELNKALKRAKELGIT